MGIYRLVLAYLVAFGHMHQPFAESYAFGVSAVISFFLLSGFVMTGLIGKYYYRTEAIIDFYIERFLRLAPQFYFYSVLTLLLALVGFRHDFMQEPPSAKSLFLQFLAIPLNFYRDFPHMLLPQGWSLGLEIFFYLFFPMVLIFNLRLWCAGLSLMIYLCAYFGVIDTDLWGYRYLPGTFFIFCIGSFLFSNKNRSERWFVFLVWTLTLVLFGLTYHQPNLGSLYNRSVLLGLIIGIPALKLMKPFSIETTAEKKQTIDGLAGNLSYGVFLGHMLVIGVLQTFGGIDFKSLPFTLDFLVTIFTLACSTLLSYISFKLVEQPLIDFRRRTRKKQLNIHTPDAVLMRSHEN